MASAAPQSEAPLFLQNLADNPHITVRRAGVPLKNDKCVVYWMQRAQRYVRQIADLP